MVYVEFEYFYRKRKILIEDDVNDKAVSLIKLLIKIGERYYPDNIVLPLTFLLRYENEEMGSNMVIFLAIFVTEIIAYILFNTGTLDGLSHMITSIGCLYILILHILMPKMYKGYLQAFGFMILAGIYLLTYIYQFDDRYFSLIFMVVTGVMIVANILKSHLEHETATKITSVFEFESNIMVLFYLFVKMLEFFIPFFNEQTLEAYNLIPAIICALVINMVKVWNLFEFNSVFLIEKLMEMHRQEVENRSSNKFLESLFELGHDNAQGFNGGLNSQNSGDAILEPPNTQLKASDYGKKSSEQSSNDESQSSRSDQLDEKHSPYTPYIYAVVVGYVLFSLLLVVFIVCEAFSDEQIYIMMFGVFKFLVICLCCEYQAIMLSLYKHYSNFYMVTFFTDCFFVSPFIFLFLWIHFGEILTNSNEISILIHAPLIAMTIKLYRQITLRVNSNQHNAEMLHFAFFWVGLYSIRETLTIVSGFEDIEYAIDSLIIIYAGVVFLLLARIELYKDIWLQLKKLQKIAKYKLYILEKLKNWKSDYQNLNQTFFLFNVQLLLFGFIYYKSNHSEYETHEVAYLVVVLFSLVNHLFHVIFDFYTEKYTSKKLWYSPWVHRGLAMGCSLLYLILAYASPEFDSELHRYCAMQCVILSLIIVSVDILFVYMFANFKHYRQFTKFSSLVISYCFITMPFTTTFIVYFYGRDLELSSIFYFAVWGFFFISIVSTVIGIIIHAILNLTEKSKRTLFVVKYISQELKKINMLQDVEIIAMIENLYDLMNGNKQRLCEELQAEKVTRILIHDDRSVEYDYSFGIVDKELSKEDGIVKVLPDQESNSNKAKRNSINFQSFLNLAVTNLIKPNQPHLFIHDQHKKPQEEQPQLLLSLLGSTLQKEKVVENKNIVELRRLVSCMNKFKTISHGNKKGRDLLKTIQESKDFVEAMENEFIARDYMHRFFHFLSIPSDLIDFQTFFCLCELLEVGETDKQVKQLHRKFSFDGQYLNEEGFRDFIVDFMSQKDSSLKQSAMSDIILGFLHEHLFMYVLKGNEMFRYYIKRRNVQMPIEAENIWRHKTNQQQSEALKVIKSKQKNKKLKALGHRKKLKAQQNKMQIGRNYDDDQDDKSADENSSVDESKAVEPRDMKKHKAFMSPASIYGLIVDKLAESLQEYEKAAHEYFTLASIKPSFSNIIAIALKIFDFLYLYMFGSLYALYNYGIENYENQKFFLSFIDYGAFIGLAALGLVVYLGLLLFHKKDFAMGFLGLDENQKPLSFYDFKFWTVLLLFLMGSAFSNFFIMASFNAYVCEQSQGQLFNFPQTDCYSTLHIIYMCIAFFVIIIYYPLSLILFPFSAAIDRTLEIKYKSQFEVLYLQCKLFVNGINVMFNSWEFETEELIKAITKTVLCIILGFWFMKLQPCSVDFINFIEAKVYMGLIIINAADVLCYFIGFSLTLIVFGALLGLYILYSFISWAKIAEKLFPEEENSAEEGNELVEQKINKQAMIKLRLKAQEDLANQRSQRNKKTLIAAEQGEGSSETSQHPMVRELELNTFQVKPRKKKSTKKIQLEDHEVVLVQGSETPQLVDNESPAEVSRSQSVDVESSNIHFIPIRRKSNGKVPSRKTRSYQIQKNDIQF